jgi:hypothetical protein
MRMLFVQHDNGDGTTILLKPFIDTIMTYSQQCVVYKQLPQAQEQMGIIVLAH